LLSLTPIAAERERPLAQIPYDGVNEGRFPNPSSNVDNHQLSTLKPVSSTILAERPLWASMI
jgi:hypothetical protein